MPQGQMGNVGPVPNMGNMGMPPQYSRMAMTPGVQPITSQRRPSTLQYQPSPQNQTSMPGNPPGAGNRYMPMCDNSGMQGPVDQKPIIDPMGMPMTHMKPSMNNCNSPMMDIKPQISMYSSFLYYYPQFQLRQVP